MKGLKFSLLAIMCLTTPIQMKAADPIKSATNKPIGSINNNPTPQMPIQQQVQQPMPPQPTTVAPTNTNATNNNSGVAANTSVFPTLPQKKVIEEEVVDYEKSDNRLC